jgi:hypothetical protein
MSLDRFHQSVLLLIADYQIDARQGGHAIGITFRVTASHDQQSLWLASVGLADHQPRTTVAQVRHRTGIDDIDIGGLIKFALHKTSGIHLLANGFAIGLIDFAAQRGDRKGFRMGNVLFAHRFSVFSDFRMICLERL